MHKLNRQDAEDIAEEVTQMLQPVIKKVVAGLLLAKMRRDSRKRSAPRWTAPWRDYGGWE